MFSYPKKKKTRRDERRKVKQLETVTLSMTVKEKARLANSTVLPLKLGQDFKFSVSKQDIFLGIKTNVGPDETILMSKFF